MGSSNPVVNETSISSNLKPQNPICVEKPAPDHHHTETEPSPSSGTTRTADETSDDVATTTTEAPVIQAIERPPLASHESVFSIHMFGYLAHEHEDSEAADMRKSELGIAEATMKEVIKECEAHQNHGVIRPPRRTKTTTTSFAFSVMGGESERGIDRTDDEPGNSPAATRNTARCKWFACFSCCKWC